MPENLHIPIGFAGEDYSQIDPGSWETWQEDDGVEMDLTEFNAARVVALCIRAKTASVRLEWSTARNNPVEGEPEIVESGDVTENFERQATSYFPDAVWTGTTPPPWIPLASGDGFLFGMPQWVNSDSGFGEAPLIFPNCTIHEGKFYSVAQYLFLANSGDSYTVQPNRIPSFNPAFTESSCIVTYTNSELKMVSHTRYDDGDDYRVYDSTITFTVTSLYDP